MYRLECASYRWVPANNMLSKDDALMYSDVDVTMRYANWRCMYVAKVTA